MTRLWDKGAPLDERVLAYTAGEDYVLDNRLLRYDIAASSAHADMLAQQGLLSAADHQAIRGALAAIGEEHAQGRWRITLDQEDCQTAIENRLTERIGAAGGRLHAGPLAQRSSARRLAAVSARMRRARSHEGAMAVAEALEALAVRDGAIELPGYTHMQQAMPSTVALWALGFAAEIRDDAEGLSLVERRSSKNPLGSAAGYGTPESRGRPRVHAPGPRVPRHARARHGRAAVARQSRGASAVRDHAAEPGPGPPRGGSSAVLYPGVRFRRAARGVHDRLVHHAAEAQSRRVRAHARAQRRRAGGAQRGARHHRRS